MRKIYTSYGCHELSQYVTRCITESHNVHKFTLDATCVQKGVQLVTKVCYNLEFSYIYKHLIINKKDLWLIAEGCTSGVHIINWITITYVVLLSFGKIAESPKFSGRKTQVFWRLARLKSCRAFYLCVGFSESLRICLQSTYSRRAVGIEGCRLTGREVGKFRLIYFL